MGQPLAIYYTRLSTLTRSKGGQAVAAAAYRAGARLHDERTGTTHDYCRRRGVIDASLLAPAEAGPWARDLETVWNRVEAAENRRNSCIGRELLVALPAELAEPEAVAMARAIGQDLVARYGVVVLVAVHRPDPGGDTRNIHAHLMFSTRVAEADGFGAKTRVLDDRATGSVEATAMRERVAARINAALARAGVTQQVDPRPWATQAHEAATRGDLEGVVHLSRVPQRHQGRAATAAARRGEASPTVTRNMQTRRDNAADAQHFAPRAAALRTEIAVRAGRSPASLRPTSMPAVRVPRGRLSLPASRGTPAQRYAADLAQSARDWARMVEAYLRTLKLSAFAFARLRAQLVDQARHRAALDRAIAAHGYWMLMCEREERSARAEAVAEAQATAQQVRLSEIEADPPSRLRRKTRREWADLRRAQRAAVAEAQAGVTRAKGERRPEVVREAHGVWQDRHAALLSGLDPPASPEPAQPAPTPQEAPRPQRRPGPNRV